MRLVFNIHMVFLRILHVSFQNYLEKRCARKIFDGRPREWRSSSGKEIEAFGGYWTVEDCKKKCLTTPGCEEFRVKKNEGVSYSGCVLMRSGTTRSGEMATSFEMYKLVKCTGNSCIISISVGFFRLILIQPYSPFNGSFTEKHE